MENIADESRAEELLAALRLATSLDWTIRLGRYQVCASVTLSGERWQIVELVQGGDEEEGEARWGVDRAGEWVGWGDSALDALTVLLVKYRELLDAQRKRLEQALATVTMRITEMADDAAQPVNLPAAPARRAPQGSKKTKPARETPRIDPAPEASPEAEPELAHSSELEQLEWLIDEARLPLEDQGALLAEIRRGYQVTELTALSLEQLRQLTTWLGKYPAGEHRAVAVRQRLTAKK